MNTKMKIFKTAAAAGPAIAILAVFVLLAYPQSRPSSLTPSAWSAIPGSNLRIDMDPVIGMRAQEAEDLRMVLRPSQAQGPQSDLVLRIVEFAGAWFRVQIPQNARLDLGPCRLLLLDPPGNILATSGNRFFRIVSIGPKANLKPAPGADPRAGAGEVRPKTKMTTPGVQEEAQDPVVLTATTISAKAKRLPITLADYVTIGLNEIDIKQDVRYPLAFTLPADVRTEDRAVLTFIVNAEVGGVRNELFISINGQSVESISFGHAGTRAWSVTFNARALRSGRNEIVFSGMTGGLRLKVKEVVLWFHRIVEI